MSDAKSTSVPLAQHFRLSSTQCLVIQAEKTHMNQVPYAHSIGSIMYAMVCSTLDISHAVIITSRLIRNPGREH